MAYIELNMLSKAVKAKPMANIDFIFTCET